VAQTYTQKLSAKGKGYYYPKKKSLDLILGWWVISYLGARSRQSYMQMLHRVLREDGMILIAEPVADIAILNKENGQEQSIRQVSFYEELFETYGFQILDS
jgi:predicted SAM-dependent methyltransferase